MISSKTISDCDVQIQQLATQLKLGTEVISNYRKLSFNDPGEFLKDLLLAMVADRQTNRIARNLKCSRLPRDKTLETFIPDCLELPKKFDFEWYRSCSFIEERQNLILLGNPGTGKTHFAAALGTEACKCGYKPIFKRMANFVEELSVAHEDNTMKALMRKIESADLLILDEWGYLPTNVTGTRLLFDVINDCYEKRSVILTTNLPLAEWNRIFGDERLLVAIMDRLTHHGHLIKHSGESYRLTHSLMR